MPVNFDSSELNHLYRYCLALCGNPDNAYDLLQDAIEKYLKQSGKTLIDEPQGYVKRTARNQFYDQERRKKVVQFDVPEDQSELPDLENDLEHMVVDELLLKQIWKTLSPKEREVLFLWAVEGLTMAEIAMQLDVPIATILSRLHRLRARATANETFASSGGEHA